MLVSSIDVYCIVLVLYWYWHISILVSHIEAPPASRVDLKTLSQRLRVISVTKDSHHLRTSRYSISHSKIRHCISELFFASSFGVSMIVASPSGTGSSCGKSLGGERGGGRGGAIVSHNQ